MKYRESSSVELKREINPEFKKEIVAFANSDGGEIYIGVEDDGGICGIENPQQEMERISSMVRDGIRPDLTGYTAIECLEECGRTVIRLSVSRGGRRPYHLRDKGLKPGGVFVRHGTASVPASEEMIREMIRQSDGTVYDRARSVNQDLTFDYTERYFKDRGLSFTIENQRTLGLVDGDGYYTNTALLLSAQCAHSIKCAVYEGTGKTKFKTRREFTGPVLQQLEEAYAFLELNNDVGSDFEGLKRIDHYSYPQFALREALLNTIVHRDYDYSGSTLVSIFDDRIEFVSLGGLVKGITMTDILRGVSQSRNMVLAAIFYRLKLIESYGTGIQRIMEGYGGSVKKPEFLSGPASFLAVLPDMNAAEAFTDTGKSDEERVMGLFLSKSEVRKRDVQELLGCSAFPAGKLLNRLIEKGYVTRRGNARATRYELSAKGRMHMNEEE